MIEFADRPGLLKRNFEFGSLTNLSVESQVSFLRSKSYNGFAEARNWAQIVKGNAKTVIVIVGMPGAGKSLASSVVSKREIPVFVSGDIIRAEAKRRKLLPTRKNLGRLMLKIRHEEGMGAVAKRLAPLIEKIDAEFFVYEGARNVEEVDELSKKYRVLTIAIHASPASRFQRLLKRRRSDRPRNWSDFLERDERELKVGVGKLIAIADRVIENEDTKNDLRRRTGRLLKILLS